LVRIKPRSCQLSEGKTFISKILRVRLIRCLYLCTLNLFLCKFRSERTILLKYLKIYLNTDLKICRNNYAEHSQHYEQYVHVKSSIDILATSLSVLHNYFDGPIKLFSDLYVAKFLNKSAKPFFPCRFRGRCR